MSEGSGESAAALSLARFLDRVGFSEEEEDEAEVWKAASAALPASVGALLARITGSDILSFQIDVVDAGWLVEVEKARPKCDLDGVGSGNIQVQQPSRSIPNTKPFRPSEQMSETAYRTTPLFGGAITADIPASWKDVSDFRHVPDTQEVWVSPDTSAEGEISFILEVLEHVEPERPEDAIKFHFEALAEDNSAESHSVDRIWTSSTPSTSAQTPSPTLLAGTQSVRKYGRQSAAPAPVQIYMALWRYPQRKTDLVMSFNVAGVASSTSAQQAAVLATFERAASSLVLVDANLFG